ncbi:MAG: endonuclease/exonuclease/phosphatase family protein [Nocardioides sp.]
MSARATWTFGRHDRLRRLLVGALAVAVLAAPAISAVSLAAPAAAAPRGGASGNDDPVVSDVTLVQANIYTGLTVERFQKDVATVLATQPDFVTYNEVPFRSDAVMAPTGYSIYRDMRNRFTAATPVAWRSDKWTALDQGVFRISNWRGKPKGRVVEIGRRFANWATLQDVDGRTVSVVSVHIAPLDKNMPDLLRRSVERLTTLTDQLSIAGPVLVGGDFNVHYTSGRYPRDLFEPHGLVPTFDTLGNYFPTGDHQGATIDYVFARGSETIVADQHYPVELKSDHDAVVAGLSWVQDVPTDTILVRSDPEGSVADRRSVLRAMKKGINDAPAGATLRMVSSRVDLFAARSRLVAAARRGVSVQVSVVVRPLTAAETGLRRQLRETGQGSSWVRRCQAACAQAWAEASPPRTLILVSDATGAWTVRQDVSRWVTSALVERSTQLTVSTGKTALDEAAGILQRLG